MPQQLTPRDAVTRAMAAMEIAETCTEPRIRSSFTNLAEEWLTQAEEIGQGEASHREDSERV
ncbi:MAG TPA: hypothetical protein VD906_01310 [Caulobacteraceae bacterium]|nr:hypothetical protein [Caulobacteraceae bacterium]